MSVAVATAPPATECAGGELPWRLDAFNKFLLSVLPLQRLTPSLGVEACRTLGFTRMAFLPTHRAGRGSASPGHCAVGLEALAGIRELLASCPWIAAAVMSGKPAFTASVRMNRVLPAAYVEALGICALFCVPVYDSEGPLGAMIFDRGGDPFGVDELLVEVALAMAESIGCALEAAGGPAHHAGRLAEAVELSLRQLEMLQMMAGGLSNKEIAEATGLSTFTVRDHISALLRRLDAANRSAAVMRGWQLGLLQPSPPGA